MKLHLIFFVAIFFSLFSPVHSQSVPGPFDANSFSKLSEDRAKLNILLPDIERQLAMLNYDRDSSVIQRQIKNIESDIKYYENEIDSLSPSDTSKLYLENRLEDGKQRKEYLLDELKIAKENIAQRIKLNKTRDSANNAKGDVEYNINQLMIPKLSQQNFMFWASIAFVLLMCFILFTFFQVIQNDQIVRKLIFGSDSGIQFITLFSIIIAIILFGLTGVLEGRELAALLGSVAGYILGRTNARNSNTTTETNTGTTPATTIGTTPGITIGTTPETTVGITPETTIGTTPETTIGTTPETTIGTTPETTVGTTPETTPGTTPETTPGTTPETTPGIAPETTPGIAPETTLIAKKLKDKGLDIDMIADATGLTNEEIENL